MTYYIDADMVTLGDLRKRIEETDLVPSRASLLDGIETKFGALKQQGITTLTRLRFELKNSRRLEAVSKVTGINKDYLILLRREIESYFPKPFALKSFDWLPGEAISKLEVKGIRNTEALYQAVSSTGGRNNLIKSTGVDSAILDSMVRLADLTRLQWISPMAARMLVEAGYDSASKVAAANAEGLCKALQHVNEGNRFFKGKIGLRDIKRLIKSASYVPHEGPT